MTTILAASASGQPAVSDHSNSPSRRVRGQRRQYTCAYCAKVFKRSEHRIRHERTHTNEKPFSCRYCRRAYSRKYVCCLPHSTYLGWVQSHSQSQVPGAASPLPFSPLPPASTDVPYPRQGSSDQARAHTACAGPGGALCSACGRAPPSW
ncbi:hypothetical protein B0T22DRAFT_387779 [Podospora appendiculata]|uniref:C2H2-type domain-containing protein n=1 Tax=Podospora appendiculata TaxID=314037 RepID=A0AAE0WZE5_9PEZI|nr:hypothetical protein B0T22DRAFT_387779 [Podospora appendiculata]